MRFVANVNHEGDICEMSESKNWLLWQEPGMSVHFWMDCLTNSEMITEGFPCEKGITHNILITLCTNALVIANGNLLNISMVVEVLLG